MIAYIKVEGVPVKVQVVTRKDGSQYVRKAPDFWDISPAQAEVRNRFTVAAFNAFDYKNKSRERVVQSVKAGFYGWQPSEPKRRKPTVLDMKIAEIKARNQKEVIENGNGTKEAQETEI